MSEKLDQLTVFKASELRKQGYKDVGFVLQNEFGQIGVVAHAAVRWLHTPDEFFAFMHPDESQPRITEAMIDAMVENADRGYEAQLRAALAAQEQQETVKGFQYDHILQAFEQICGYDLAKDQNNEYLAQEAREAFRWLKNGIDFALGNIRSQAQQPEYTFDQLTKMMMQAATKEGHKVTMKIKWALPPAPEGDKE